MISSDGIGAYASLAECENSDPCYIPSSWDCMNGVCIDPGNGNGFYSSVIECQQSSSCATYNCVNGICTNPGDGSGVYNTLEACESVCSSGLQSWICINEICC